MKYHYTVLDEPLSLTDANRLAKEIIKTGTTTFSDHALEEMRNDQLTDRDVINVIRGGYCESNEHIRGTWRYRMKTSKQVAVIAFRSATELRVVTAWRVRQ